MSACNINFIKDRSFIGMDIDNDRRERMRTEGVNTQMVLSPKFGKQPKTPAVYKVDIKNIDDNKVFKLLKDYDRMPEPEKKYGNLTKWVDRSWNTYVRLKDKGKFGFGIAAVGFKGMGKTDFLSALANRAIDSGMIVVLVSNVKASIELVNYLATLDNVFIMFDEFAKNFDYRLQEKMLTMFNNLDNKNRFLAISENSIKDLSDFFLDRPGRIHYLLEFETTDNKTIEDYCSDKNVAPFLIRQILDSARKTTNFSFDFLQGIVLEHEIYPEDSLDEMLEYLNLKRLTRRSYLDIIKIEKIKRDKHNRQDIIERREYEFSYKDQVKEKDFKSGRYVHLNILNAKLTEEEKIAKSKEEEEQKKNNNDNMDSMRRSMGMNPFMSGGSGERLSFSSSNLDLINKEEINGNEYLTYIIGDFLLTVTFGE